MSRRVTTPPDWKRGRHRKQRSAETREYEREQLIPPPPPWMDAITYTALASLRADCDGSRTPVARSPQP